MARAKKISPGPWFRMYASILDNPKFARLTEAQCWNWAKMLALAVIYGGIIPNDLTDVAYRLRKPIGKVRDLIQVFLTVELLDRCSDGYVPHDWEELQFASDVSTGRVKAFRERQRNVSETSPETEAETDSETERKSDDDDARARSKPLLGRICEILRISLTDDPQRLTWGRTVEEMLRDGLNEAEIIAATEIARTHGKLSLAYIRAVALNPKPKEPANATGSSGSRRTAEPSTSVSRRVAEKLYREDSEDTRDDATGGTQSAGEDRSVPRLAIAAQANDHDEGHREGGIEDRRDLAAGPNGRGSDDFEIPDFLRRT